MVAADLPGLGGSAVPDGPPDADRVLAWLEALVRQACPAPPALVGASLGPPSPPGSRSPTRTGCPGWCWWTRAAWAGSQRPRDLPDPSVMRAPMPLIAPGRGLSLPALARAGTMVDEIIHRRRLEAPPAEPDEHDTPVDLDPPSSLDLRTQEVGSVIWCTGFTGDFSWLDPALVGPDGQPRHTDGATPAPGLWYLGLRWLRRRCSGILLGLPGDAAVVAAAVRVHLGG